MRTTIIILGVLLSTLCVPLMEGGPSLYAGRAIAEWFGECDHSDVGKRAAPRSIDTLPYFLQGDDKREEWTLGGADVLPGKDPEGSGAHTIVLTKYHSGDFYEVFRLTPNELQLRYEVFRPGGASGEGNWIRRFEEIGGEGAAPGAVWMRRRMVPGERITTRCRIDRFTFNKASRSYVHDAAGSLKELAIVISVHEVRLTWPRKDLSGFGVRRALRLVSDWHPQGQVIETYDYARGKGMVNWRWLERVSTLTPDPSAPKPCLSRCLDGTVLVEIEPPQKPGGRPRVYRCNAQTGARETPLELVQMESAFRKDLGKTWYVAVRDLSKEGPLVRKQERVPASYALPEWTARPGATIADLPYVHTRPPARGARADAAGDRFAFRSGRFLQPDGTEPPDPVFARHDTNEEGFVTEEGPKATWRDRP